MHALIFKFLFIISLLFIISINGETIYVSPTSTCEGECGTLDCRCDSISKGIFAAQNYSINNPNDTSIITISCAEGVYLGTENINLQFLSNNYQLISEGGSDVTFLYGEYPLEGANVIFEFENSVGENLIQGFTIVNFLKLVDHSLPFPLVMSVQHANVRLNDIKMINCSGDLYFATSNSNLVIENSQIFNLSISGKSLIYSVNTTLTINDMYMCNVTSFKGNTLFFSDSGQSNLQINNLVVENIVIASNFITNQFASVSISNSIFIDNTVYESLLSLDHGSLDFHNCTFTANHFSICGICATRSMVNIDGCVFENNSMSAGSLLNINGENEYSQATISNTRFFQNDVFYFGAFIMITDMNFTFINNVVDSNLRRDTMGKFMGLITQNDSKFDIQVIDCVFNENLVVSTQLGTIFTFSVHNADIVLRGNLFRRNRSNGAIITISSNAGMTTLFNSSLIQNEGGLDISGNSNIYDITIQTLGKIFQPVLQLGGHNHTITNVTFANFSNIGYNSVITIKSRNVHFNGCTFTNNSASHSAGISKLEQYGLVSFTNCTFDRNFANSGGVFLIDRATVNFVNCSFNYNRATLGGVISMFGGFLKITSSTFDSNSATLGGCIFSEDGKTYISNTIFRSSSAQLSGGSLAYADCATGVIQNSQFENNTSGGTGGAVFLADDAFILFDQCLFKSNSADSGGAVSLYDLSAPLFLNTTFIYNWAKSSAGALLIHGQGSPIFTFCNISYNQANSVGGAIILEQSSQPIFNYSVISYNFSPNEGGGIHCIDRAALYLDHTAVVYNHAGSIGGGISFSINSTGLIQDSVIQFNNASSKGGGIAFYNNCCPTINNTLISENVATSGAGAWISDIAVPLFVNTVIDSNNAYSQAGGCLVSDYSNVIFRDCQITSNIAQHSLGGGMVIIDSSNVTLINTLFHRNIGANGGALYISSQVDTSISGCEFSFNQAIINGGAFTIGQNGSPKIINSTCSNNKASSGGCMVIEDTATPFFKKFMIFNNSASEFGGGVSVYGRAAPTIIDSSISHNQSPFGGGFYSEDCSYTVTNSLIFANEASSRGGGVYVSGDSPSFNNVTISENFALYGGGIVMESDSLNYRGNKSLCISCTIIGNVAAKGGGIFLEFSAVQPSSISESSIIPILTNRTAFTFQNAVISNNKANIGAGIYYATVISTVTFGPKTTIFNNSATDFGGGVYITYSWNLSNNSTFLSTWLNNANFAQNSASFGGYNVAWFQLPSNYSLFCSNCTFGPASTLIPSGYADMNGFATAPSYLLIDTPCPPSLSLNSSPFSISLILVDKFSTIITGEILHKYNYLVNLSYTGNTCQLTYENQEENNTAQLITNGHASFLDLVFQAKNGSNCQLIFSVISSPSSFNIESDTCNISLTSCPTNQHIEFSSPFDYCADDRWHWETTDYLILIISLLITLVFLLLISNLIRHFYINYRKKRKYMLLNQSIPDLDCSLQVTLDDILNDPAILRIPWDELEINERIGVGASGIVSKGIWTTLKDGHYEQREIATKELLYTHELEVDPIAMEEFLKEVKLMSNLKNEYIVEFLGVSLCPSNKLYLVTELMHYGSLRDLLDKKGQNLSWKMRLKLLKDAAKGMAYLHSRKVIHRDLKPQNLLVNNKWKCKIADFGISTISSHTKVMTCVGTPVYMAKEVLLKDKYSEKADVYSFGVMMVELFTGERPYTVGEYSNLNQAQLVYQILQYGAHPDTSLLPPALSQLVYDCWNDDPNLRPSFAEIIVRLRRLRDLQLPKQANNNNDHLIIDHTFTHRTSIRDFGKIPPKGSSNLFNEELQVKENRQNQLDTGDPSIN